MSPLRRWVHLGLPLPVLPLRALLEEVLEDQRVDQRVDRWGDLMVDRLEGHLEAQWVDRRVARLGDLMVDRLEGLWGDLLVDSPLQRLDLRPRIRLAFQLPQPASQGIQCPQMHRLTCCQVGIVLHRPVLFLQKFSVWPWWHPFHPHGAA